MRIRHWTLLGALALSACNLSPSHGGGTFREPNSVRLFPEQPQDQSGRCWANDETPAVIETVSVQVIERHAQLAPDGSVLQPAQLRTETRQRIVSGREVVWFETPCPNILTPDFISSLQRGLSLRSIYVGPAHGEMDRATQDAVRVFQKPMGLNSPVLSMVAARRLGLIEYSREDIRHF